MRLNKIIVIGGIHHNTLGVIRSLAFANVHNIFLILVGNDPDFISCTKYIKRKNIIKLKSDSLLLDTLLKIGPTFSTKPTIICSSDSSISIIDRNLKSLSEYFLLPNAFGKQGEINRLMDKTIQCSIAKECGLHIPQSKTIANLDDLNDWDIFPCIVKPLESIYGSKNDIKVYYSKDDLYKDVQNSELPNFQIQQFIEKNLEFQLIGCSMNYGNDLIIPGYTNIIRQPPNTNTGYLYYQPINSFCSQELHTSIKKFMQTIGYEGLFSLEFLRDKAGWDYFLEINMRNDGNSFCVTRAGVNLPHIFFLYKNNIAIDTHKVIKKSVYFMPEIEDLVQAKKQKINPIIWLKQFLQTEAHAVFSLKDPLPFIYKLLFFLQKFARKQASKSNYHV